MPLTYEKANRVTMSCEVCGDPFSFFKKDLKGRTSQYLCKKCSQSFWNRFSQKLGAEAPTVDLPTIEALARLEQKVDRIMRLLEMQPVPKPVPPRVSGEPIENLKTKERAELMEELEAVLLVRRQKIDRRLATPDPSSATDS